MVTGDQLLVKQLNKSIVLNVIRKKHNISRAEISNITGLNKSTVSSLVDELITEGFVVEKGPGISKGGRKPILLNINNNVGHIIGIDLGVNYILIILTDLSANIIWQRRIKLKANETEKEIIDKLITLIQEAISASTKTLKGILGIGIGVPGIVDFKNGIVLMAPNLRWEDIKLKAIIEERFGITTYIDNEANAGAIGEKWFGAGSKVTNLVYVSAGIGIGTGIIINDELYRGSNGFAGEMGHMTVNFNDHDCRCGNIGCWENYASEKALFSYLKDIASENKAVQYKDIEDLSVFDVMENVRKNDQIAVRALREVSKNLGIGVVNVVNTFNPDLVIIGNTLSLGGDIVLEEVKNIVNERSFISSYYDIKIRLSKLGMYSCAIGAVSLVISKLFASPQI
jgi:IclR helix-turn-helix domain./ROK family.